MTTTIGMAEKYPTAPVHLLDAIAAYVNNRTPVGGFLTAVLENNLREAMGCADQSSRHGLFDIVMYCHWEIPSVCWGSPAKVEAWLTYNETTKAQENERFGEGGVNDAEEERAEDNLDGPIDPARVHAEDLAMDERDQDRDL